MTGLRLRMLYVLATPVLALGALAPSAASAVAKGGDSSTCVGGSIAAGTYGSLVIDGFCAVDSGSVSVQRGVTVMPGAGLLAAFGGSDLSVGGNLIVERNGALVLGCGPGEFICFNDPDQVVGTLVTNHSVRGNLIADGALAAQVRHSTIGRNVVLSGGGGGVNCDPQAALHGSPAFLAYEDNVIGGNATISGLRSCWAGFIRNTVSGNVNYDDNVTADPDGNEIVTNTISGRLNCSANSPAPQVGDSGGSPNSAGRGASGQCAGLVG